VVKAERLLADMLGAFGLRVDLFAPVLDRMA